MESFFSRYRNEWVLLGLLFFQLVALATQVQVPESRRGTAAASLGVSASTGSTRLIRVWAVAAVSPLQKLAAFTTGGVKNLWHGYIDLRGAHRENEQLKQTIDQMRLEQVRLQQDAEQGKRLQSLLGFREQYIAATLAAQVIGTSGTDLARVIYIDRGTRDSVQPGMAVITPDGIVGKISRADRATSQVLLISDPQSGAGVLLERLRLNGILKGSSAGYPEMLNVMADEKIEAGDRVITTGGDRVYPKGLPVGTVLSVSRDNERDPFLAIRIKPAVNLGRLEEVLVVTRLAEREPEAVAGGPARAADILAEHLPSARKKTEQEKQSENKAGVADDTAESVPAGVDTSARIELANPKPATPAAKPATPPAAPQKETPR